MDWLSILRQIWRGVCALANVIRAVEATARLYDRFKGPDIQ